MIPLVVAISLLAVCALTWFADAMDKEPDLRAAHVIVFVCFVATLTALGFGIHNYYEDQVTINRCVEKS